MIKIRELSPDQDLPNLADCLDPIAMRPRLQAGMFPGRRKYVNTSIQLCSLAHTRYKPGRYCIVGYKLATERANRLIQQSVYGRMVGRGESAKHFAAAQRNQWVNPIAGEPCFHIPEYEMCCWTFPNDRKLLNLPKIVDPDYLIPRIESKIFLGSSWRVHKFETDVIQYVPEHTCTVSVSFELSAPTRRVNNRMTIYGKTYADDHGVRIFDAMNQLYQNPAVTSGQLRIARPLLYDYESQSLWQDKLEGRSLASFPWSNPGLYLHYRQAGAALATLHSIRVEDLRSIGTRDILERFHETISILARVRPSYVKQLDDIAATVMAKRDCLASEPLGTVHGDAHRENFWVHDQSVGLIDWDSITYGPILYDLASLVARVHFPVATGQLSAQRAEYLIQQFLQGYRQNGGFPIDSQQLAWHTAIALIAQSARSCATRFRTGRFDTIDRLITVAQTQLENKFHVNDRKFGASN